MEFGLNRLDMTSLQAFVASACAAETAGWDYGLLPSSPLLVQDPYVLLADALRATTTLKMGPLIENPVMRTPAVLAGSTATVASLAPGRVMLGLGVGDTAVRLMGRRPARVAELEAAVVQTRTLLSGAPLEVGAARPARLRHANPAEVWVAAGGPRTLRMAGRVADGVFVRVGTHPGNIATAIAEIRKGAEEAGRLYQEVKVALIFHTVVCDDPERAGLVARSMAAGYLEYSPMLLEQVGWSWQGPPLHTLQSRVWPDFHHASDLYAAGSLVDFLPDSVADAFCVAGSWPEIRRRYVELAAAYPEVTLMVPHPVPAWPPGQEPNPLDYLKTFAREVIGHVP